LAEKQYISNFDVWTYESEVNLELMGLKAGFPLQINLPLTLMGD